MPFASKKDKIAWRNQRRTLRREFVIQFLGGHCVKCGYSGRKRMHFHHIDQGEKTFHWSRELVNISEERMLAELKNTILMCDKCHHAFHKENGYKKPRKPDSDDDDFLF